MNIKVRLFATFREGRGKEILLTVDEMTRVEKIIDMVDIKAQDIAILLVNGRDGKLDTVLKEGDALSLFPPVGGG